MDIEMLKEFIKPELLILIPVLYFIATAIKNTLLIKDKYIPLVLGLLGIVLAVITYLQQKRLQEHKQNLKQFSQQ